MPRKNQNVQQSLGNPFPNLPLIESKTDKPTEATKLISDSGQPIYTVVNQPNENDAASGMESCGLIVRNGRMSLASSR